MIIFIHQHKRQQENKQHNNKNRINNLTNVNTLARYVLMPK